MARKKKPNKQSAKNPAPPEKIKDDFDLHEDDFFSVGEDGGFWEDEISGAPPGTASSSRPTEPSVAPAGAAPPPFVEAEPSVETPAVLPPPFEPIESDEAQASAEEAQPDDAASETDEAPSTGDDPLLSGQTLIVGDEELGPPTVPMGGAAETEPADEAPDTQADAPTEIDGHTGRDPEPLRATEAPTEMDGATEAPTGHSS